MCRIMYHTATTQTNGVSFSLVAGACCYVHFSNNPYGTSKSQSLNINSTGAKSISHEVSIKGEADNNYKSDSYYPLSTLFVYNGSSYLTSRSSHYGDYND